MLRFIARRIVVALVLLFVSSSASFFFFAWQFYPLKGHPVLPAYWRWLRGIPTGRSFTDSLGGHPLPFLFNALGHTAALLLYTLVLVAIFALALGLGSAATRGSAIDLALRLISYVGWAVPAFLLALVAQQVFGKVAGGPGLGILPVAGWAGKCPGGVGIDLHTFQCPKAGTDLTYVKNVLLHLTLPAVTLAVGFIGLHSRYLRQALVSELARPYISTARGKGVPEYLVLLRHALRNSLVVFVPAALADFGAIFGATLAVDWVFGLNGLGGLFVAQMNFNSTTPVLDTYAMQVLLLMSGAVVLVVSLVSELTVTALDPRGRFEQ